MRLETDWYMYGENTSRKCSVHLKQQQVILLTPDQAILLVAQLDMYTNGLAIIISECDNKP